MSDDDPHPQPPTASQQPSADGEHDPPQPMPTTADGPDDPSQRPPPDGADDEDAPYKRRVGVLLAGLAVLGAWIGILHINAATNESNTARQTTRIAVEAQASAVVEQTVLRLVEQVELEADTLGLRPTFTGDASEIPGLDDTAAQARLSEAQQEITQVLRRNPGTLHELKRTARRRSLTQAALTETRITWNARASQYETVLTTLGIAIFLVGFTLVLSRRIRPPILVPGVALALYCFGWAVHIYLKPIPSTAPAAIDSTAQGEVLFSEGQVTGAIAAFDDAIAVQDDYLTPYEDRSIAHFVAANPDFFTTGAITDTESPEFVAALDDATEALDLGGDQSVVTMVVSGVLAFADGDYDTAVRRLTAASELNDQTPGALLYLSAAETARGNGDAADRWRDRAVALLSETEPSDRNRQLAAAYYTALEWVAYDVPEQADAARAQRDELVELETSFVSGERVSGTAPDEVTLTINDIVVGDDTVDFDLAVDGVGADDTVTLLAYERPVPDGPWVQPPTLSYIGPLVAPGSAPPLQAERACRPTEFRVDLYVNGAPADSATSPGVEPTC
jgi:tetratricopeptide (TPR) repeat protein